MPIIVTHSAGLGAKERSALPAARGSPDRFSARVGEFTLPPYPTADAADVHGLEVVMESDDDCGGNGLIAEALAPLLEAHVARAERQHVFIAAAHELEVELRASARDQQKTDLADHYEAQEHEGAQPSGEVPGLLCPFGPHDQIREHGFIHTTAFLGGRRGEADREQRIANAGGPRETTFSFRSGSLSVCRLSSYSRVIHV